MPPKKKKDDFDFYWNTPEKFKGKAEPPEFQSNFARNLFPEMRSTKTQIQETKDSVIVRIQLPGFRKDEITINIVDNRLGITAAKHLEKKSQGEKYYRNEMKSSTMRQEFSLPASVDSSRIETTMEGDILTAVIPKKNAKKKEKEIK